MAKGTSSRLNLADLGMEYAWRVDYDREPQVDVFTKGDMAVAVRYSPHDSMIEVSRKTPFATETASDDVYGQAAFWLSGGARGRSSRSPWVLIKDGETTNEKYWTLDQFVDAIGDPDDRAFAVRILDLFEDNARQPRLGIHQLTWFGERPGGGIFPHPFGLRYAPFYLVIKRSGDLAIAGMWNEYPGIKGNPGFAELAELLGLDENGPASQVPVAGLDPDNIWMAAESVAGKINS